MSLKNRDRILVEKDGEEITVFNWVTINQPAFVRGGNPVVERLDADIYAGDSRLKPDAVTPWVAEELQHEFSIDVEDHDIEVINPENDAVTVL